MVGFRPRGDRAEVFRPWRVLAWAMGGAGIFWIVSLVYLLHLPWAPTKLRIGAAVFAVLYCVALAYYLRTAVFVDTQGVTFRGLIRTRRFLFRDIRTVKVLPGPIIVYAVLARGT